MTHLRLDRTGTVEPDRRGERLVGLIRAFFENRAAQFEVTPSAYRVRAFCADAPLEMEDGRATS